MIYPLMPKGVEHHLSEWIGERCNAVIYPLMPKGVEHMTTRRSSFGTTAGDLSFDAERR